MRPSLVRPIVVPTTPSTAGTAIPVRDLHPIWTLSLDSVGTGEYQLQASVNGTDFYALATPNFTAGGLWQPSEACLHSVRFYCVAHTSGSPTAVLRGRPA